MKNIVIFGAPGSGKGTNSAELVKHFGYDHISTGDVLRGEIKAGSELGKTAQKYMDQGQLIPDALMIDILTKVYDGKLANGKGVIFDGFPRTIAQAEALKKMLDERGQSITVALNIVVDENILMERLLKRASIEGRADDNEVTIKKRFEVYNNQTKPLLKWFEEQQVLDEIVYDSVNGSKEQFAQVIIDRVAKL